MSVSEGQLRSSSVETMWRMLKMELPGGSKRGRAQIRFMGVVKDDMETVPTMIAQYSNKPLPKYRSKLQQVKG